MDIKGKRFGGRHWWRISCFAALAMAGIGNAAPPSDLAKRVLDAHNAERKVVGTAPLAWRADLAEDARKWAEHLARTGTFDHAPQQNGAKAQGENLWQGTKDSYTPEEMVQMWIDEKADYQRGLFPKVSRTGNWPDVGHYTQLIWYRTTHMGCAVATGAEDDVLVCRYSPPGNWVGEDAEGRVVAKRRAAKRGLK